MDSSNIGLFYVRFMDDVLVLDPSRWKLRRAVKALNEVLEGLRLAKHPDKTFIGRIERGFDFLGYHFGPAGLAVARETLRKFVERALWLYEQEPGDLSRVSGFGAYVRRWARWANAGLGGTRRVAGTTVDRGARLAGNDDAEKTPRALPVRRESTGNQMARARLISP